MEEKMKQVRVRLESSPAWSSAGESREPAFEILAISAGVGNGWEFSEEVLRASLAKWEGVECFIDHAWRERSLRDLAGVCFAPGWDKERRGISLRLRPVGPSGALLAEVGRQMLEDGGVHPDVGFSADVVFSTSGKRVSEIMKVFSVDLVYDPARGGAFLRALNQEDRPGNGSMDGGETMEEKEPTGVKSPVSAGMDAAKDEDQLETTLAAARLPGAVSAMLQERFSSQAYNAAELQSAIDAARQMVSDLTGGLVVQGPGRVSGMVSPEDQVSAALHDLLGAARPEGLEKVRAARLSGIRELYMLMTGDYDFAGGFHPERAQFASTASLPGLLKNALNKLIVMQWEELGRSGYRWWEPLVQVEHFNSLQSITGVLVGEVTVLPSVAEGAPYTELDIVDSAETGAWGKYGGYLGLTLEMFERDESHRLRQYPRKLASAALRRISALVGGVFTANSGAGPQMADGYNVFDAMHHGNLGVEALSTGSWEAASQAIYSQALAVADGGTAPRLALDARYLVVPRTLRLAGMQILYPTFAHEANIFSENMQRGQMGDVITCPEFSDAADWAALADPHLAPGIIVGERFGLMPEIFIADSELNGALFTNDEIRMKVRHWVSVFVADHRPLYKANVP